LIKLLPIILLSLFSIFIIFARFLYLSKNILTKHNPKKLFFIFLKSLLLSQVSIAILADSLRAIELKEISNQREKSVYIILIERFSGLVSNLILLLIFFNYFIYNYFIDYFKLLLVFELILIIIFIRFYNIFLLRIPYLNYIFLYVKNIQNIINIFYISLIYSLVSQIISIIIILYSLTLFFNLKVVFSIMLFIQLSNLIIALPIFINGIGIREALYGIIFHTVLKLDYSYAFIAASIINISTLFNLSLLFIIFIIYGKLLSFDFIKIR